MKHNHTTTMVVISLLLLIVAGCGGLFIAQRGLAQALQQVTTTQVVIDTVVRQDLVQTIVLNGQLDSVRRAELAFGSTGRVAEVLVEPGASVHTGQSLISLETRDLDLRVQSARAALAQAQAHVDQLLAGPPAEHLAQAAQTVAQARSNVNDARVRVTAEDITAAHARVERAEAAMTAMEQGPKPFERATAGATLEQARATFDQSQADFQRQRDAASLVKTRAQAMLEDRANAVRTAQASYSKAFWEWDYVANTGYDPSTQGRPRETAVRLNDFERQRFLDALHTATLALADAERAMQQAQTEYEQAQRDEIAQVQALEAQQRQAQLALQQAERDYDQTLQPADAEQLAAGRAEVADARAQLQRLLAQADGSGVAAAAAALRAAEVAQAALQRGDPAALADAEAQRAQRQADLSAAETALANATLRAPWNGVVLNITTRVGEQISADAIVITLADSTQLRLQGSVDELDVLSLRVGLPAVLRVDALPTAVLRGTVTRVARAATQPEPRADAQGTNASRYAVQVQLNQADPKALIGMAASATIEVTRKPGVLVIPRRALMEMDGQTFVERMPATESTQPSPHIRPVTERIAVTVGLRSTGMVEIVSGLQEGDRVLALTLPPPTPTPGSTP